MVFLAHADKIRLRTIFLPNKSYQEQRRERENACVCMMMGSTHLGLLMHTLETLETVVEDGLLTAKGLCDAFLIDLLHALQGRHLTLESSHLGGGGNASPSLAGA